MAEVAVREEGDVEEEGGEDAAGDEEGLEGAGADVGDVGYRLAVCLGGVDVVVCVDDPLGVGYKYLVKCVVVSGTGGAYSVGAGRGSCPAIRGRRGWGIPSRIFVTCCL